MNEETEKIYSDQIAPGIKGDIYGRELPDMRGELAEVLKQRNIQIPGLEPIKLEHGEIIRPGGGKLVEYFGDLRKQVQPPRDNEFFRVINSDIRLFVFGVIEKLLVGNSVLKNIENLQEGYELNKEGKKVFLFCNHQSESDPAVFEILLKKAADEANLTWLSEEISKKLVTVAGLKIYLNPLRRFFTAAINLLITIADKYRMKLERGQEARIFANAYVANVSNVLKALAVSPEHLCWIHPEGGRTKNKEMLFQRSIGAILDENTYIIPIFIDGSGKILPQGGDGSEPRQMFPAEVEITVGKPLIVKKDRQRSSLENVVLGYQRSLREAGADLRSLKFGTILGDKRKKIL